MALHTVGYGRESWGSGLAAGQLFDGVGDCGRILQTLMVAGR
ncbi:hypothetical protein [Streptomyces sp. Ac-502]